MSHFIFSVTLLINSFLQPAFAFSWDSFFVSLVTGVDVETIKNIVHEETEIRLTAQAKLAEERNSQLQNELNHLIEAYKKIAVDLDVLAKKNNLTTELKANLDSALANLSACLRDAPSAESVRICYKTYKSKYDDITDDW